MKNIILLSVFFLCVKTGAAQTCYSITNRTNGNGNPGTCGSPNCSANAKTGHIDVNFGANCPSPVPTLVLTAVSSGSMPNPFCFDPGSCTAGTVRYCFRGNNLPSAGFMTLRFTVGTSNWSCTYDVNGGSGALLPVQLSYFNAKLTQQKVLLEWRTEQETDNDGFEIERSENGRQFLKVGSVKGQGTVSVATDYSFTDPSPLPGISFYRLRQIDLNGQSKYSSISKIDNRIPGVTCSMIYPNPARDHLNLNLQSDHNTPLYLRILDAGGKKIAEEFRTVRAGNHIWRIQFLPLKPGIYLLEIIGETSGRLTEKFIVI